MQINRMDSLGGFVKSKLTYDHPQLAGRPRCCRESGTGWRGGQAAREHAAAGAAAGAASAVSVYGQQTAAQSVNKVLYFANTDSRQGMQQINNAIRAITSISADLDLTQRTLEVSGTAKEIELAEWVFNELDRPATAQASQSPNSTTYTEELPNEKTLTEVVRVFYFTNSTSPKGIQEKVNTIRAIAEIVRLMPVNERSAIVLRGSVDRMGLAEWLFNELNQLPTAQWSGVLFTKNISALTIQAATGLLAILVLLVVMDS